MPQNHLGELLGNIEPFLARIDQQKEYVNELTIKIAEIAAPPFEESTRAEFIRSKFESIGYKSSIDGIGNVLAYKSPTANKGIVVSAHLDTVFPDKSISITRDGDILRGPGIGDDSRGLANLVLIAEVLFLTPYTEQILFVATVGEEGRGDLRGVKYLFNSEEHQNIQPRAFVSIDGTGVTDIVDQGIGSLRYRIHFHGPGGHSYGSFGTVNPSYPMANFITNFSNMKLDSSTKSSFNIGKLGGGTAINAIPEKVWVDIDMRSTSKDELSHMAKSIKEFGRTAVEVENKTRQGEVSVEFEKVGDRPAGKLPQDSWIRRCVKTCHEYFGLNFKYKPSSTDANVPLSQNIGAIAIASVEKAGRAHTYNEWIDASQESLVPIKRNLLLIILLTHYK